MYKIDVQHHMNEQKKSRIRRCNKTMVAAGFCTYATEDENSASRVPAAATSAAYLKKNCLRNRQKLKNRERIRTFVRFQLFAESRFLAQLNLQAMQVLEWKGEQLSALGCPCFFGRVAIVKIALASLNSILYGWLQQQQHVMQLARGGQLQALAPFCCILIEVCI